MKPCLSIVLATCGTGEGTGTPWYGYGCWVRVLGTGAGVGYGCWVRVLGTGTSAGYGCWVRVLGTGTGVGFRYGWCVRVLGTIGVVGILKIRVQGPCSCPAPCPYV